MQDFIPRPTPWAWSRTALVLSTFSAMAWLMDDEYPRFMPWALIFGVLFDVTWHFHERKLREKAFRVFKTYALQEAWLSSTRFRQMMNEEAFVALFEDCLRNEEWRQDLATMLKECSFECRRDPLGDPAGLRVYWKLRYPHNWTNEQRIGALIACIGSFPNRKFWMVQEDATSLKIETEIFLSSEPVNNIEQMPQGAKEFCSIFQRDLSRLIDIQIEFAKPKFTTGLNANVELSVPCVLPLADNSFLHIALADNGKLTAVPERDGKYGTMLEYGNANELWEVWRNAVIVEKKEGVYVASVPESVLTPEEKNAAQERAKNNE